VIQMQKETPKIYEGLSREQIEKLLETEILEYRKTYDKIKSLNDNLFLNRIRIKSAMEFLNTTDFRFQKEDKIIKAKITPSRRLIGYNVDMLYIKYPDEVVEDVTSQELNVEKFKEHFRKHGWNDAHIKEALAELKEYKYGKPKVIVTATLASNVKKTL